MTTFVKEYTNNILFFMINDDAIKNLEEALQFSPDNVPLRKHLAELLVQGKRYQEAIDHYNKVLEIKPGNPSLQLALADAYFKAGNPSPAYVIIEAILDNNTPPPEAFLLHAKLLSDSNDFEKAQTEYKKAISLKPELKDYAFESELKDQLNEKYEQQGRQKVHSHYEEDEEHIVAEIERPSIDFSDVGGMTKVKEEIEMKIILPLKHPELYKAYGKKIGGGILMYGPPGCGKTHLARATTGEVKAGFISVGINDILDMWMGNSEKNLHNIFELARKQAPTVLFFDEVDALGANRSDMRKSGGRHLINQFLSEMDGISGNNEGVLILAATNTPWHLDPAFRRPGRFDRFIFVAPPDTEARKNILEILIREKPTDNNIKIDKLAQKTKEFSGADLKAIVDIAIENKLRHSMRAGKPLPLEHKDFIQAISQVRSSTKEWFTSAKNYALYANEGGLYDEILKYLNIKK